MIDANALAEDLARTLSGEKAGIDVEKLKANMRIVADHYDVPAVDRREMWAAAMRDMAAAAESFDFLAGIILGPCRYINEGIHDSIALARADGFTGPWQSSGGSVAHDAAVEQKRAIRK